MTQEDVKTWTADDRRQGVRGPPLRRPATRARPGSSTCPRPTRCPRASSPSASSATTSTATPRTRTSRSTGSRWATASPSKLEIFGNFGLQNRIDADALVPGRLRERLSLREPRPGRPGVGDIKLGAQVQVPRRLHGRRRRPGRARLREAAHRRRGRRAWARARPSFGGDLIISKRLDEKADIHGSIGYQVNSDPDGVDIGNAFKWALGLNLPACHIVPAAGRADGDELHGRRRLRADQPARPRGRPRVLDQAGLLHPARPLLEPELRRPRAELRARKSWTGRHISIGYHPGHGLPRDRTSPPPPPPPPSNGNPTVSAARSSARTCCRVRACGVRATASDPDGDPLTYDWSATAGTRRRAPARP